MEPQPPHAAGSVCSSTQAPLQREKPVLQVNVQALLTHAGCALATVVAHAFPHALQLLISVAVSTQLLLQRVGIAAGQLATQFEPEHTGVPPLQACPQVPQLLPSFVVLTQAPPHRLYPGSQVKLHTLATHVARALATFVVHASLQEPQ